MKKIFIILLIILTSCGARKVDASKISINAKLDSTVTIKVDGTYVQENNVVMEECIDEVEYAPADTSKPMIINGKKYINTIIKSKKQKKKTTDNTKAIKKVSSVKKLNVKKEDNKKIAEKKIDRKQNYWNLLWFVLPFIIILILYKYGRKFLPFAKIPSLLER